MVECRMADTVAQTQGPLRHIVSERDSVQLYQDVLNTGGLTLIPDMIIPAVINRKRIWK